MLRARITFLLASIVAVIVVVGCGSSDDSSDSSTTASAEDCTPDQLDTVSDGKLTVATDKPAYPPYFEDDDPTNGKGFESAVAYAIADQLGYDAADVEWVTEPFNASYAPGPKDFDFDVNQISITPKRAEQVDFSAPYYEADQAVVALKDSAAADATSLADLQDAAIGVQIGTTSLDAVNATIQPSEDPKVFNTSNDVVTALKEGQVDAIVVDVPTAFYLTATQVPEADDDRPVPGARRRRVGRAAREGLAAHRLRLVRGRRAEVVGRAARPRAAVDERRDQRARPRVTRNPRVGTAIRSRPV